MKNLIKRAIIVSVVGVFSLLGTSISRLDAQQITFFNPNTPAKKAAWNKSMRFHEFIDVPEDMNYYANGKSDRKVSLKKRPYYLLDNRNLIDQYYTKNFRCPFYSGSITKIEDLGEGTDAVKFFPHEYIPYEGNTLRRRFISYNELAERLKLLQQNGAGKTDEAKILQEIVDCFKQDVDSGVYTGTELPKEYNVVNIYFDHDYAKVFYTWQRGPDGRLLRLQEVDERKMSDSQITDNLVIEACRFSGDPIKFFSRC